MKKVTEIIEIVFENVQLEKIVEYLNQILSNSTLKEYNFSTDSTKINLHSTEKLYDSIEQSSNGAHYFNFINFSLKDILLSRVGFQIYKYNNIYDLSLDIEEIQIKQKISVSDLQNRIGFLASELEVTNYYCGYEPAEDEDMRLFSRSILGPLSNWIN